MPQEEAEIVRDGSPKDEGQEVCQLRSSEKPPSKWDEMCKRVIEGRPGTDQGTGSRSR